MLGLDT